MLKRIRKAVLVCIAVLAASGVHATPKGWSEREAIAEAQHDIHAHNIKFYLWGGYAPRVVGVPDKYLRMTRQYPTAMAGQGCVVYDEALNERQRKYAETYNARVLAHILKKK